MRWRISAWCLVLGLATVACGGGQETAGSVGTGSTVALTSSTTASSEAPGNSSPTTGAGGTAGSTPDPDRPQAPDFELTLGDGSVFHLLAETKPVYLVFWAEW